MKIADATFMARAIQLAKKGHYTTSPNPRVGCVLVNYHHGEGLIIGEGFHQRAGEGHAEVNAIAAAKKYYPELLKGATAFVTLEPCSHFGRTPPCAQGLIEVGVARVVAAMVDPNPQVSGNGLAMLEQAGITVEHGVLEAEANALNPGFIKRMQHNLPYVRCKLAASLDGKTAMQSGESKWITSSDARADVQRLRAQSCAIISGADSILTDNAKMTVRWAELGALKSNYPQAEVRQPVRVVIDSKRRLTPELAFFSESSNVILVRANDASNASENLSGSSLENLPSWPHFVEQVSLPTVTNTQGEEKICLTALLELLAQRGFNELLIESGAKLAGAFIEQDLVDELILYQAPTLMGGDGKSLVEMPAVTALVQAKKLAISDIRMVGSDIRLTATFKPN